MATSAGDQVDKLKSLIIDLEERRQNLRLFDGSDEINSHCDDLIGQVTLTVESAMDHLNKVQDRMIDEVNEYRRQLLDAQDTCKSNRDQSKTEKDLRNLSAKIEMINSNKMPHDEALELAKSLLDSANSLRKKMRAEAFGGEFLRFFDDDFQTSDIIGRLEKTKRDVQDDFTIKHVLLDEMVSSAQVSDLISARKGSTRPRSVTATLFLRDGNLAVGLEGHSILIWDPKASEKHLRFTLKYHRGEFVTALAQLPSGHLVSGSNEGKIEVWDMEDEEFKKEIGYRGDPILWLKALQDGRLIVFGRDIRVWNLSSLDNISTSPIFRFLAQVEQEWYNKLDEIDAWNTLKQERKEDDEEDRCYLSKEISLYFDDFDDFDPDHNLELRVHMDMLWDGTLAYSYLLPPGPKVTIWDPNTDKSIKVVDFEAEDAKSCTVLPNGDVVICRADDRVEIYSLDDEKMHTTFKNDKGPIVAIRMQSENSLLFVHLEDPELPILRNERQTLEFGVTSTCMSDDGKRLAIGSSHERLVMWPIQN